MATPTPVVSIIIPLYNREEIVKETLDSVLAQTYPHWECIIVDDISTDNSLATAKEYAARDNRFKAFQRDREPKGAPTCRNIGVEISNGEYIAFLDSDDKYFPNHIERRIEKIKENNADFIYGSAIIDGNGLRYTKITRQIGENENPINFLLGDGFAQTSTLFLKRSATNKIKWDENLKRHQDYEYFDQAARNLKLFADTEPTVLINWTGKRDIDFESSIQFIEKHINDISPENYLTYNKSMFESALTKHETEHYAKYYRQKAKRMIKYLSLMEFLSYYRSKEFFKIQFLKFYFTWLNLFTGNRRH